MRYEIVRIRGYNSWFAMYPDPYDQMNKLTPDLDGGFFAVT